MEIEVGTDIVLADPTRKKSVERERERVSKGLEREGGRKWGWVGLIVELRRKTEALLTGFSFSFFFWGVFLLMPGKFSSTYTSGAVCYKYNSFNARVVNFHLAKEQYKY